MGAASSKIDDDKALQLCRERKKLIRQALDGRCALASAHISYIYSLKHTGTTIRKFVQPDGPLESSLYASDGATPVPLALTDKSYSRISFPSPSASQRVETNEHLVPSMSPSTMGGHYQVHRMNFRGSFIRKVEEKPPAVATGTVTSFRTPQSTTPRSLEKTEQSPSETPTRQPGTPTHMPENSPWDYFGLFHPIDNHLSPQESRDLDHDFGNNDDLKNSRKDEEVSELEDDEDNSISDETLGSESDEFDNPSSDTLVRSFKNLNREESFGGIDASPTVGTARTTESESKLFDEEKVSSPRLSPLKTNSSEATHTPEAKVTSAKNDAFEHKIAPKDFFSSIKEVENLFVKASESGKEVPRMLEANKLHFRPLLRGHESGSSTTATLLKACFSCGEDPSQVQEEPAQNTVKFLTWHRTASFRSSSSRNPLDSHSREDAEDLRSDLFEDFYKISGSHASTLDRVFAWEKKLYDEVKASQLVRREYDLKCKFLREQESRCESQHKVDKTRAVVKDLHSRIRVAIHRIDTISRRIEELRDKELQPQLEELVEGLRRMWEVMAECHKQQVQIIAIAYSSGSVKLSLQSEVRRHLALQLEDELSSMSLCFAKWMYALNSYIQAIDFWLHKCVRIKENFLKKRRWGLPIDKVVIRSGPPIYTTCGSWLESMKNLPVDKMTSTIKELATVVSHSIPHQEKVHGKKTSLEGADPMFDMHTHEALDYDKFQKSFACFLTEISKFADSSLKMYSELQTTIEEAKRNYEHRMSQP